MAHASEPLRLAPEQHEIQIPEGYTRVRVAVRPGSFVSIAIFGEQGALAHFSLDPPLAHDPLDEDGLLPRVASFLAPDDLTEVIVGVEVHSPASLHRLALEPSPEPPPEASPLPLLGLPAPATRDDGYLLERPGRYQFARPDVLSLLIDAFRDTRRRFRRDPIGVLDISQWDARRPALDRGNPRHSSHEGGRDVDISLPSTEEPSTRRDHCDKLISRDFSTGLCRKGTARAVDHARLAFLLGKLVKTGRVDRIFLDVEFIGPTAEAARRLVQPKSFPAWVADKLQPTTGIVRHVAWHTDHVHVRFLGPRAPSPYGG